MVASVIRCAAYTVGAAAVPTSTGPNSHESFEPPRGVFANDGVGVVVARGGEGWDGRGIATVPEHDGGSACQTGARGAGDGRGGEAGRERILIHREQVDRIERAERVGQGGIGVAGEAFVPRADVLADVAAEEEV